MLLRLSLHLGVFVTPGQRPLTSSLRATLSPRLLLRLPLPCRLLQHLSSPAWQTRGFFPILISVKPYISLLTQHVYAVFCEDRNFINGLDEPFSCRFCLESAPTSKGVNLACMAEAHCASSYFHGFIMGIQTQRFDMSEVEASPSEMLHEHPIG